VPGLLAATPNGSSKQACVYSFWENDGRSHEFQSEILHYRAKNTGGLLSTRKWIARFYKIQRILD
jgi:hypothetical protein